MVGAPDDDIASRITTEIGFVYFIHAPLNNLVKIGHCFDTLHRRIGHIRAMSPSPLVTLGVVHGGFHEEHTLHKVFADLRDHGEWFRYEGDLVRFVESWASPWPTKDAKPLRLTVFEDVCSWQPKWHERLKAWVDAVRPWVNNPLPEPPCGPPLPTFGVGDEVEFERRVAFEDTLVVGRVIVVVRPNELPNLAYFDAGYGCNEGILKGFGDGRDHETYLVEVKRSRPNGKPMRPWIFCPSVERLRLVDAPEPAPAPK